MALKAITLTTGIFPPDIGGPASFIPLLAQKLYEKGIDVEVITLADDTKSILNYPYKVTRIPRYVKKPWRDFSVIKAIFVAAKKSDLIFSNTLAFESAIAAKLSGKKLIQKVVGDIAWERAYSSERFLGTLDEYQKAPLSLVSKLTNVYRNGGVFGSNLIITPSMYLKKIVQGWGFSKDKIEVVYNAVPLKKSTEIIPKETFRIISVGRLIPHKGFEGIIKALAKLDFTFEYIVIGEGFLKEKLLHLAQELGIKIKFLGVLSQSQVAIWLRSSDVFILNSSYEGLPHVVLEAMMNDCPIIASAVGGTVELVRDEDNGLLFHYNDIEMLVDKIYTIKNDRLLRKKLQENATLFARTFSSVEEMVDHYIEIFEKEL